jgi:hypothetical protein
MFSGPTLGTSNFPVDVTPCSGRFSFRAALQKTAKNRRQVLHLLDTDRSLADLLIHRFEPDLYLSWKSLIEIPPFTRSPAILH